MKGIQLKRDIAEQKAEMDRISNMVDNLIDLDDVKEAQEALSNLVCINMDLVSKKCELHEKIIHKKREL